MYVDMYVCMYVYMYVCMYVCMYIPMYVCIRYECIYSVGMERLSRYLKEDPHVKTPKSNGYVFEGFIAEYILMETLSLTTDSREGEPATCGGI